MGNVTFKLDRKAAGDALLRNNPAMMNLQVATMNKILANASAQFFSEFGVGGNFKIVEFMTDRHSVKIEAADAKTAAVLKKHSGWLDKFISNIVI